MEQRRLRLGDVLDDYCPRERRLSNHVIVAIVDDEIIKTRCTTCDAEHPYKHARVPARRGKKEAPSVLFKEVLEGLTERPPDGVARDGESPASAEESPPPSSALSPASSPAPSPASSPAPSSGPSAAASPARVDPAPATRASRTKRAASPPTRAHEARALEVRAPEARQPEDSSDQAVMEPVPKDPEQTETAPTGATPPEPETTEEGPHHRHTLIRATLPRPEGQPASRQPPEFTMHNTRDHQGARRKMRGGGKGRGWSGPMSSGTGAFGTSRPPGGAGRSSREASRPRGRRRSR